MKKIILLSILGVLSVSLLSADGGIDFSGEVSTRWGVAAPWTDSDTAAGRFTIGDLSFTGSIDAYYDNSSALAEGTVSYDAINNQLDYSIDELWLDYTNSFWGLRIGRQKAAWGKADGVDITNVLCPSDMSSLSAMTNDDSKVGVDAIRLSLNGNQFTVDAYWIPFFTPAVLPEETAGQLVIEKPELAIWNGEYGLKLSGYFSTLDLSLYGFYGWDDMPLVDYTVDFQNMSPLVIPNGKYERIAMIGADAALPIGETVLRLEAAFFPQRNFQKNAEGVVEEKITNLTKAMLTGTEAASVDSFEKHNQLSALAGIDWMPEGWTLTAQYYCDFLFGDIDLLERSDAYMHGATISLSKNLLNETLELSFAGMLGFNDFDSLISPSVKYSLSDQISLGAEAYIFIPGPENDGKYGAYKDLSSIKINAKFSF